MPLELTPSHEDFNLIPAALRHRIAIFLDCLATVELCCDLGVPYCINIRRRILIRHGDLQTALASLNLEWTHPIRVHLRRIHLHFHRRVVQMGRARRHQRIMQQAIREEIEEEQE